MEYDHLMKVLLVGDSGVGKSSILLKYIDGIFTEDYMSTIGVDFKIKTVKLPNGQSIKLQIWDTAGQERFRAMTNFYYRGANCVIIVYDVTNKGGLISVKTWVSQIQQYIPKNAKIVIVGNKSDLDHHRVISEESGKMLAEDLGCLFFETSARNGQGLNNLFTEIGTNFIKELPSLEQKDENLFVKNSKKSCC